MRSAFSLIIFLVFFLQASAQPPLIFKNITRSNGLPGDEVSTIAQDSTGFIWLGTPEGLFRYDGFNFKNYSFDGSAGARSTSITKIIVDRKGRLWVGSLDAGLSCLSASGKQLRLISTTTSPQVTEAGNYVTDVLEDRQGNIWWTTTDGLFCLRADSSMHVYRIQTELTRGNAFNHLALDARGALWVSGVAGLRYFNREQQRLDPAGENMEERNFFGARRDFSTIAFQGNTIWYSNWRPELGAYDRKDHKATILYSGAGSVQPDFNKKATTLFRDSRNAIWIGTGQGVHWIKEGEEKAIQTFVNEAGNNFSLVHNKVTAILEDREGNFWFATKRGISIVRPYAKTILNLSTNAQTRFPFADKEINDVINAGKESILVGTHEADGLYVTDQQFRMKKHWTFNDVKYDWIWRFFDDSSRKRIFVSTQEGMLVYDKEKEILEKPRDTVFRNFYPVTSFVATSDSIVWMSRFWNKLMRYNLVTGAHRIYDVTKMGEKPKVLYLSKDRQNRIWILAHQAGLWRFDEQAGRIVERIEVKPGQSTLRESTIFSFLDLGKEYLLGYRSKGISLYNKSTGTLRHITRETGLSSNMIRDVIQARDGTVWIATKNGLTRYFPDRESFMHYNYETGILNNDFFRVRELADGRIVAGSTMGLVSFHPDEVERKLSVTPPMITDINIYGKSLPGDVISSRDHPVQIDHGDNYFSFEYISLHYSSPQEVIYAYKLEGLDKDWIDAGSRRFASYNRVPGGHYTFHVRARLPNGQWVASTAPLYIHVATAFYKQWWFYLLCILLAVLIMYALFRYRLHQALKVERMRTAISSDLHDEVGASLTSISLFSEMARQSRLPEHKKEEYLQRIGERSRDSIEQMSDIIWSINPGNDNLEQMLLRMKNYALEISEARDIQLRWQQQGRQLQTRLTMEQRKNFYLFFKEAINNAIKHAAARHLSVELDITSGKIMMAIADDGKGYDAQLVNRGNGLKNLHRRALQLKGTIEIHSAPGQGTRIQLLFEP